MQMRFVLLKELPPLAWCAAHRAGESEVLVYHGPAVEVRDDAFVEGAWDGSFPEFAFEKAFLAGSAGKLAGDVVHFFAPSHTFERLTGYVREDLTLISNSMAFALAMAHDELDPRFVHYRNYFQSAIRNPATGMRVVPTKDAGRLTSFYREKVVLGKEGVRSVVQPEDAPPFRSFDEYRRFLVDRTSALFANASHPARRTRYAPLASVSSGYDSGACAAISRDAGCREAITLHRPEFNGALMDHGGPTAAALGLALHEADRGAYFDRDDHPEAIFLAAGFGAEDLTLAGFQPYVGGRVLVTGVHGDQVWTLNEAKVRKGICRPSSSAASLGEFRLRENFIHFPLALLGATAARSIFEISRSEEMAPWSVGGDYDRPIARRILEEAGVARGTFAARKRGYLAKLDPDHKTRQYTHNSVVPLSPRSQEEFDRYCEQHLGLRQAVTEWRARPLRYLERRFRAREGQAGIAATLVRLATLLLLGDSPGSVLNVPYGRPSLLPVWGAEMVTRSYETILSRSDLFHRAAGEQSVTRLAAVRALRSAV